MVVALWILFVVLGKGTTSLGSKGNKVEIHSPPLTGYKIIDDGRAPTTKQPTTENPEAGERTSGDLSRIENMLKRLGVNVCQGMKTLEGSTCGNSWGGRSFSNNDGGRCGDWFKDKPSFIPDTFDDGGKLKEMIDEYYTKLQNDIAGLKQGINQCCSINAGTDGGHGNIVPLISQVVNNQQVIMNDMGNLINSVKGFKDGSRAREKKRIQEWEMAAANIQAGYEKIRFAMNDQLQKFGSRCSMNPIIKKVGNVGEAEWRIMQEPIRN